MQLDSYTGYLLILVQRMALDVGVFLIMSLAIFIDLDSAFYVLLNPPICTNDIMNFFNLTQALNDTTPGVNTTTTYNDTTSLVLEKLASVDLRQVLRLLRPPGSVRMQTFLWAFGLTSVTSDDTDRFQLPTLSMVFYVLSMVTVSIVLINLLIGVMTSRMEAVLKHR